MCIAVCLYAGLSMFHAYAVAGRSREGSSESTAQATGRLILLAGNGAMGCSWGRMAHNPSMELVAAAEPQCFDAPEISQHHLHYMCVCALSFAVYLSLILHPLLPAFACSVEYGRKGGTGEAVYRGGKWHGALTGDYAYI